MRTAASSTVPYGAPPSTMVATRQSVMSRSACNSVIPDGLPERRSQIAVSHLAGPARTQQDAVSPSPRAPRIVRPAKALREHDPELSGPWLGRLAVVSAEGRHAPRRRAALDREHRL